VTVLFALLKAVNVGGTGKMPMSDLKVLCEEAGLETVRTYIASGNVMFTTSRTPKAAKALIEARILDRFGKQVPVFIRTLPELKKVAEANPFKARPSNRVLVHFLDTSPPPDVSKDARHLAGEEVAAGTREVYVYYPDGQGQSKLVLPATREGTARNINTVTRLIDLAGI